MALGLTVLSAILLSLSASFLPDVTYHVREQYVQSVVAALLEFKDLMASSMTSSSVSSSDNEVTWDTCPVDGGQYYYLAGEYEYYYLYYYYIGGLWNGGSEQIVRVCGCNPWISSGTTVYKWIIPIIGLWGLAFASTLCCIHGWGRIFAGFILRRAMGVNYVVRVVFAGARDDFGIIWRAMVFFASEVLFILARRSPMGNVRMRRWALRIRPFTPACTTTGEAVHIYTPISGARGVRARPSLHEIQVGQRMITGGRRMGRVRLQAVRTKVWATDYNPQGNRGDCLFLVLRRQLGLKISATTFRSMLQAHARHLLYTGESVHGHRSLKYFLDTAGLDKEDFLANLTNRHRRWGNTFDVMVCANMCKRHLRLSSVASGQILFEAQYPGRPIDVGHIGHHFVGGRRRKQNTWLDKEKKLRKDATFLLGRALIKTSCRAIALMMCTGFWPNTDKGVAVHCGAAVASVMFSMFSVASRVDTTTWAWRIPSMTADTCRMCTEFEPLGLVACWAWRLSSSIVASCSIAWRIPSIIVVACTLCTGS
eukprot:3105754-Amphidinium_carterae.1